MARRDQLAGQLRQAGDKAAAAQIRSLRRPTTAAWAVNQLAATHPEQLSALVALGERLRRAHEAVLEEGNAAGVREVTGERRRLVAELADTGMRMLGKGGEAQREKISQTLDAVVADRNLAELVCTGRLTKELAAPTGFGDPELLLGEPELPPLRAEGPRPEVGGEDQQRAERRRRGLEQRERAARMERLRSEVARKEGEAARAVEKVEVLRQELQDTAQRLAVAQQRAKSAAEELAEARAELERGDAPR